MANHLKRHGHALDLDFPVRQFTGGFGNLNYLVCLDGALAVLRRPPPGPVPPGSNDMLREAKILTGLASILDLVPVCHYHCSDESILGAPFLIMEYRPGLVIHGELPDVVAGRRDVGQTLSVMLVEVLATLHRIDPGAAGLSDLGRPQGYLARTARGWARRAEHAWDGTLPDPVIALLAWLERNPVPERAPVLLHNDYKLDNLILDPDALLPRALIDWDLGTRGDPLWDLAVLLSYWAEASDHPAMLALGQMPTHEAGFPGRAEIIERYAKRSEINVDGLRHHRVLAQLRPCRGFSPDLLPAPRQ